MKITEEQLSLISELKAEDHLDIYDEKTGEYWSFYKDAEYDKDKDPDESNMVNIHYFRDVNEFYRGVSFANTGDIHVDDLCMELKDNDFFDADEKPYYFGLDKYISIIDDRYEDIKDDPSYYFCQVYKDPNQEEEYDSFSIRKSDLCGVTDYDNAMKFAVNRVKEDRYFMEEVFSHTEEESLDK